MVYYSVIPKLPYIDIILAGLSFIIIKSDKIKNIYKNIYPRLNKSKIHVIPWGIDTNYFQRIPHENVTKRKKFTIISVSRLAEKKGLIYLCGAIKRLIRKGININCTIIGDGNEYSNLNKYIEKNNITLYIKVLPFIPHSQKILKYLSNADLFVLPSIIDSTGESDVIPNACLEAMAMELPVITTRVSGMNNLISNGNNGFFVTEKDSIDLTRLIKEVMEMSEAKRRKIGKKARETVIKYFDKEKQGIKFVEFLKKQVDRE